MKIREGGRKMNFGDTFLLLIKFQETLYLPWNYIFTVVLAVAVYAIWVGLILILSYRTYVMGRDNITKTVLGPFRNLNNWYICLYHIFKDNGCLYIRLLLLMHATPSCFELCPMHAKIRVGKGKKKKKKKKEREKCV